MKSERDRAWNQGYWFGVSLTLWLLFLAFHFAGCAAPKPVPRQPDAPMPVYPPNQDEPVNPWR